jgi:hypothetical protein
MKASKLVKQYMTDTNYYRVIFNQPMMDSNDLSWDDVIDLSERVERDLSPENLTCDGEIPYAQVMPRARFLNAVRDELDEMNQRFQIDFELNAEVDQELANERGA